ncbi:MORN repeat-containing protein 2 isoform X2 [Takifugu rubripes]|uniref:MORN repeat-containing protein 2 isoform X2 n=1 Tax=Takifugu rubripes TaxID=31033 RepID=UPI001145AADA|nr:MORN repeat-containing protein 2 isoform X2 [Takifugu rubripes]
MSDQVKGEEVTLSSFAFPNGDKYEGECIKSASGGLMRSGTGKHTSADGAMYTGKWRKDKMCGRGTLRFPSGAHYKVWTFDAIPGVCRLEGNGVFTDARGLVWKGKFQGNTAPGLKLLNSV